MILKIDKMSILEERSIGDMYDGLKKHIKNRYGDGNKTAEKKESQAEEAQLDKSEKSDDGQYNVED